MATFPIETLRRWAPKDCLRRTIFTSSVLILFSSLGAFAQLRQASQEPGNERVKQILQTLEPDNDLRLALERGLRGDGVHYSWMESMRQLGVKQATFKIGFRYERKLEDLKITDIAYLSQYYQYDRKIRDSSTLEKIRTTGLADTLSSEILDRSRILLIEMAPFDSSPSCGTLYVNLLDDEVLPILDEPAQDERCVLTEASVRTQNVRLTSKRVDSTLSRAASSTARMPRASQKTYKATRRAAGSTRPKSKTTQGDAERKRQ